MVGTITKRWVLLPVMLAAAPAAWANDISPWTPAPGSVDVELVYTYQEADSLYAGEMEAPLPRKLSQDSYALNLSYGATDRLAFDLLVGYAQSDFLVDPMLAPQGGLDGLTDVFVGVRYKLLDETAGQPLTLTAGVAGIIDGGYRTGALPAIGDGGSGGQVALAAGRSFGVFSLSGDIGYRTRTNNVPNEVFGSINASVSPASGFSIFGGLAFTDSTKGLDIGGPGFSPARFPEVEEDYKLWSIGASAYVTDRASINLGYGKKFDGRNTARSDFLRVGLGYSF